MSIETKASDYNYYHFKLKAVPPSPERAEEHGLISSEEREQLFNEFERIEESSKSRKPRPELKYDTVKYPTIYDYLRENVREAPPEACAALRESMVVRNKFEHYIEHMKSFRGC